MDLEQIIQLFGHAASFLKKPFQDGAGKAVGDLYEKLKEKLKRKTKSSEDAAEAVEALEKKPESKARAGVLLEELEPFEVAKDKDIQNAASKLRDALNSAGVVLNQSVNVTQQGNNNSVAVAGRDLIQTKKVTKKTEFTPDERHITSEQGTRIKDLIAKLAEKLHKEDGTPNFKRAYGILYDQFKVSTFREILREDFNEAVGFLQQQNAMNRSRLRRGAPDKYKNQLYGAIYAKGKSLGWEKTEVLAFARERLSLNRRITSLKALGPNQLKKLNELIGRQGK